MRFKRQRQREATSPNFDRVLETVPHIDEFMGEQSERLVKSAQLWESVGGILKWTKEDPDILAAFDDGVRDCFETSEAAVNPVRVQQEASRLVGELGKYTYVTARCPDIDMGGISASTKLPALLLNTMPGAGVPYILQAGAFPKSRYLMNVLKMRNTMRDADKISDTVLGSLCDQYAKTPENMVELAGLYGDDIENAFPAFSELRNMMIADWHRLDPETSVLRRHADRLSNDPGVHIAPFCEAVARGEDFKTIEAMSRYAILSAGGRDVSPAAVAEQMFGSRDVWSEVPNLQEGFNDYIDGVSVAVTKSIEGIVGPRSLRNVRLERSGQEVMEVSTNFAVYSSVNAENARQADSYRVAQSRVYRKGKGKNRGALVAETPTTDDSIRQLGSELLTERSVKFARYVNGRGYELHALDEASPELIAEEFSLERDQKNLAQDMANAVDYLRQPASSYAGVRKLQSTDLRLNGKRHSLWRLAPDKAPGLKVEGNNRYYRLVYTIIDGSVVVYDIVSHADFDKKYST